MRVSQPVKELPRLSFIHIPKTAGTSITSFLSSLYGEQTFPAMTTLDYACYSDEQLARYRLYKGHAYRRDYERLGPDIKRLTILRDPVDRARSFWSYYRGLSLDGVSDPFQAEAIRLAKHSSPLELIYSDSPFVIEHLRLGQVRQFLPEDLLAELGHRQYITSALKQQILTEFQSEIDRFDAALTCDMLPLSFPAALRALRLAADEARLKRENVSPESEPIDMLQLRRAIHDVSDVEFACYEYVRRREIRDLSEQTR